MAKIRYRSRYGFRHNRGLVIGLVVLLVAVLGLGGYLVLHDSPADTSGSGGSSSASANANGVVDPPVAVVPAAITPLKPTGNPPTAAGIDAALAGQLGNTGLADFNAYFIDPATDTVLLDRNGSSPQAPASAMKLLTGAAVLTTLDPQSRLVTKVVQGDAPGTVVFVGGGDVTLSARAQGADTLYEGAPLVSDLAAQIIASGVTVDKIVLDTSRWTGPDMAGGWKVIDIGNETNPGYITHMSPLMVDGDRFRPGIRDSGRTGTPAMTAGKALALALGVPNVTIEADGAAAADATVLGQVSSQPISVLLAQALENSDNVLAEALARQVAIAKGAPGSFVGATASVEQTLGELGLDTTGIRLSDSSGLSSQDLVTPKLLAQILAASVKATDSNIRDLIIGLPVAGASGTLATRFSDPGSAAGRGWVRAKTGSLDLTYALAGVVPDADGRLLVFAIISNGVNSTTTRPAQDAVVAGLRACGCA